MKSSQSTANAPVPVSLRAPDRLEGRHLIGKVKEPHGLKGDLYVLLFAKTADWLESQPRSLFLCAPEGLRSTLRWLELEVQELKPHKEGLILRSHQVQGRDQSEALKGHFVYLPEDLLVAPSGERPFLSELLHIRVKVEGHPGEGLVEGFSSNGAQDLLQIRWSDGGLLEVPFVEAYVGKMDLEDRELLLTLPPGFFELFESQPQPVKAR